MNLGQQFVDEEISKATLLVEDLIGSALEFLKVNARDEYDQFVADNRDVLSADGELLADATDADRSWMWNEDLWALFNDIAPDGTVFGSHEGNGSLIGFWKYDEEAD